MEVCRDCGTTGHTKRVTRGSLLIEIVLWLCFLVPGLIYSLWRISTRYNACRACGSRHVVPLNSPVGAKLAAENGHAGTVERSGAEKFGRAVGRMFASRR
ncbi:YqaE/Pmp3 family membrane protein [Massilia sp. 9096]|uniref:YqaE/Pmp3 family membrane protein n=1 Tax=Massilia sp. 9096 TaxID=1500894 RepID=UPI0012E07E4D